MSPGCDGDTHRYRIPLVGTIPLVSSWSCACGQAEFRWRPPNLVTFTWWSQTGRDERGLLR